MRIPSPISQRGMTVSCRMIFFSAYNAVMGPLALPGPAMLKTRALLRADLHAIFDYDNTAVVEDFVDLWFQESTQDDLKKMVARLGKK